VVKAVRDRRAGRGEEDCGSGGDGAEPSVQQDEGALDVDQRTSGDGGSADASWWTTRAAAVLAWLDANPLEIGVPNDGCLATIRDQLNRGDKHGTDAVRRKCWKHIAIELDGVPGWDSASAMPNRTFLRPSQIKHMQKPPAIPNGPLSSPPPVPTLPLPISIRIDDVEGQDAERLDAPDRDAQASPAPRSQSARSPVQPASAAECPGSLSARTSAEDSRAGTKTASWDAGSGAKDDQADDGAQRGNGASGEAAVALPEEPPKPLSKMTMLERQAYWMQRRRQSIEAARAEKVKEDDKFTFKPNTERSKRTFRTPADAATQPCPASSGTTPVPNAGSSSGAPKPPSSTSSASASGGHSGTSKPRASKTGSSSAAGPARRSSVKSTAKGDKKDKNTRPKDPKSRASKTPAAPTAPAASGTKAAGSEPPSASLPMETAIHLARRHSEESMSQGSRGGSARVVGGGDKDVDAVQEPSRPETDSPDKSGASQGEARGEAGLPEPAPADKLAPEAPEFVPGQFWWKVESGRGHHRVRDGGEFQMWSIYRKKDKTRDVSGVSMLVGRTEQPPYEEKVIQMMWDTEAWSEEAAFKWWHENKHRYVTSDKGTGRLVVGASKRSTLSQIASQIQPAAPAAAAGGQ